MNAISADQVRWLLAGNHAVAGYPRKGVIVVDGFKRFKADKAAIEATRQPAVSLKPTEDSKNDD